MPEHNQTSRLFAPQVQALIDAGWTFSMEDVNFGVLRDPEGIEHKCLKIGDDESWQIDEDLGTSTK